MFTEAYIPDLFLFKLLKLIECSETELAELGCVLLLLGELLGVPVEDGVKVGWHAPILRAGRAVLTQRLGTASDWSSK